MLNFGFRKLESILSVRGTTYDGSFVQQYKPETWLHIVGWNFTE